MLRARDSLRAPTAFLRPSLCRPRGATSLANALAKTARTPRMSITNVDGRTANRSGVATSWISANESGGLLQKTELRVKKGGQRNAETTYIQIRHGDRFWFLYPDLRLAVRALYMTSAVAQVSSDLMEQSAISSKARVTYTRKTTGSWPTSFDIYSAAVAEPVPLPQAPQSKSRSAPTISRIDYYVNSSTGLLHGYELFSADGGRGNQGGGLTRLRQ